MSENPDAMNLFDPDGDAPLQSGGADMTWRRDAMMTVRNLRAGERFTTDLLWQSLNGGTGSAEPRAIASIMRSAAEKNLIVPTEDWEPSAIPACHRRPKRVWLRVA